VTEHETPHLQSLLAVKIYSCFHCSAVFYTLNGTHITLLNHKFSWLANSAGVALNAQLHRLIICVIF